MAPAAPEPFPPATCTRRIKRYIGTRSVHAAEPPHSPGRRIGALGREDKDLICAPALLFCLLMDSGEPDAARVPQHVSRAVGRLRR